MLQLLKMRIVITVSKVDIDRLWHVLFLQIGLIIRLTGGIHAFTSILNEFNIKVP